MMERQAAEARQSSAIKATETEGEDDGAFSLGRGDVGQELMGVLVLQRRPMRLDSMPVISRL